MKEIWSDFCIAVGNPNRYHELVGNRTGRIAGFLAILILISSVFGVFLPLSQAARGLSVIFTEDFPRFSLSKNGFKIDRTVELDAGITLFRATNEEFTDESEFSDYLSAIVLDEEKAVVKNGGQLAAFYFADLDDSFQFQNADLERFRPLYYGILAMSGILMVGMMIAKLFLSALVLALLAQLFGGEKARSIRFDGCFRMALYTRTLPILLGIVLSFFGVVLFPVLSLAISGAMMWFVFRGMSQNPPASEEA